MQHLFIALVGLLVTLALAHGFSGVAPMRALRAARAASVSSAAPARAACAGIASNRLLQRRSSLQMNFFEDAFRFFANMKKEASAKHILIKGSDASVKLEILKKELAGAEDLSSAFSELASKVSECPSANRGGNLGTFKPGMMVKEFDKVCFEKEVCFGFSLLCMCRVDCSHIMHYAGWGGARARGDSIWVASDPYHAQVRYDSYAPMALPCLALPCLALPCLALPCLALPGRHRTHSHPSTPPPGHAHAQIRGRGGEQVKPSQEHCVRHLFHRICFFSPSSLVSVAVL